MAIFRRFVFAAALGGLVGLVVAMILATRFLGWFQAPAVCGALGAGVATAQSTARSTGGGPVEQSAAEAKGADFVSVVLADTEDTWGKVFRAEGKQYRQPKLVLFRDGVASACGYSEAAVGPFYCPGDEKVYLDLGFFD